MIALGTHDGPRIVIAFAQSLDGRIATLSGQSKWISGPESLVVTHRLRREYEAILVGVRTVIADDPELTCRLTPDGTVGAVVALPTPARIVLDPELRIPPDSKIVTSAAEIPSIVFTFRPAEHSNEAETAWARRREALERRGVRLELFDREPEPGGSREERAGLVGTPGNGTLSALEIARRVGHLGFRSLMVEGGSRTITSFLRAGVFDRLVVTVAPLIVGEGIASVGDIGIRELEDALRPRSVTTRSAGRDLVFDLDFGRR